jgi:hypothetical protein
MSVFEVDRDGLRKILERRGKEFALYELWQDAVDQKVQEVRVTLTKPAGSRFVTVVASDDDPDGFADLRDSYTLFAESSKKGNPRQRGRFNIGLKLVIALCEESRITTTKGGVEFIGNERRMLRKGTNRGSVFEGKIRMTNEEFEACCQAMLRLIPPDGIDTYFNGGLIPPRVPIAIIENKPLMTELADNEGLLRRSTRQTEIRVYKPLPGEIGMLYEMGIPVVETGDDFHADIQQRVPLNTDRDNVPPAFLRTVRTAVLNQLHGQLDQESANHLWVKSAMEDPDISEEAVRSVIQQRFGDKVAVFDPRDPEANNRAVANGFRVVHGRELGKLEWTNVRSAGVMPSAGSLFPTHPGKAGDFKPLEPNAQEAKMIAGIKRIARVLIGADIEVEIISDSKAGFSACYGGRSMTVNKFRVGNGWFAELNETSVGLVIHELGHEYASNHLSDDYYRALTKLGARLAIATAKDPSLLVL